LSASAESASTDVRYRVLTDKAYLTVGLERHQLTLPPSSRVIRWVARPIAALLIVLTLALGAFRLFGAEVTDPPIDWRAWFAMAVVLLLLVALGWPREGLVLLWRSAIWLLIRRKSTASTVEFRLHALGLDSVTAHASAQVKWSAYVGARVFQDGILLRCEPNQFLWLPDAALVEGTQSMARAIVRGGIAAAADVTDAEA